MSDHINEADIAEGAGADEEICLLPDTEREITEADKLKALSVKKSTDIVSDSSNAFDSLLSTEGNLVFLYLITNSSIKIFNLFMNTFYYVCMMYDV